MAERMPSSGRGGPLAGVRVLDCTSVVMGPYATSLLADLGAEVIKVEPRTGDVGRQVGASSYPSLSVLALRLLRSKEPVPLDLADPADAAQFGDLVRDADAVVTNIRPTSREHLGLNYASLQEHNPDIILCTGQAYSSHSRERDRPGYDDTIQALSGMVDTYLIRDGEPAFAPSVLADKICGQLMALSTVAALYARTSGHGGQWVDVPMLDNMAAFNLLEHLAGRSVIPPVGDVGWDRSVAPERRPHATRDGWVCVLPYTDRDWARFTDLAGRPQLRDDPRLSSARARSTNSATVQATISEYVRDRSTEEVLAACARASIACAPVQSLESLVDDPYLRERGVVSRQEHPQAGEFWQVALPLDFSGTPLTEPTPAQPLDLGGGGVALS